MKEQSEKLFRAIGDVGDDLIARADAPVRKAPRVWVKWAALAACCALVIGAAARQPATCGVTLAEGAVATLEPAS